MPEIEPTREHLGRWARLSHSLSAKLITLLLLTLVAIFGLLGYLNIRLHRQHLETAVLGSAERISDVIKRILRASRFSECWIRAFLSPRPIRNWPRAAGA